MYGDSLYDKIKTLIIILENTLEKVDRDEYNAMQLDTIEQNVNRAREILERRGQPRTTKPFKKASNRT